MPEAVPQLFSNRELLRGGPPLKHGKCEMEKRRPAVAEQDGKIIKVSEIKLKGAS